MANSAEPPEPPSVQGAGSGPVGQEPGSDPSLRSPNVQDPRTPDPNTQDQYKKAATSTEHARETHQVSLPKNGAESAKQAEPGGLESYKALANKEDAQEVTKNFTKRHKIAVDERKRDWAAWLYWSRDNALGHEDFPSDEKKAFKDAERLSFFKQTYSLRAAVLFVGVCSATCQGWYQSAIASTAQYMINDFGLVVNNPTLPASGPNPDPKTTVCSVNRDLWIVGGLVSATSLAAGVLGVSLSDPFQNHILGRRGTIITAAALSTIATICLLFVNGWVAVIGLRSMIGFSLGMKASVIPPFVSEISPPHLRGRALAVWQLGVTFGIFVGFICWVIVDKAPFQQSVRILVPPGTGGQQTSVTSGSTLSDRAKWKVLSVLPLISTIPLLFTAFVIPESPIFLLKIRKYNEALDSAVKYASNPLHGLTNFLGFHFEMATETQKREEDRKRGKEMRMNNSNKKENVDIELDLVPSQYPDNQPTNPVQLPTHLHPEPPNTERQSPAAQDTAADIRAGPNKQETSQDTVVGTQAGPSRQETGQDQRSQRLLLGECRDQKDNAKPTDKATGKQKYLKRAKSPVATDKLEQREKDSESNLAAGEDESDGSKTDDRLKARFRTLGKAIVGLFRRRREYCPHDYHMRQRHYGKRLRKLVDDPRCFTATLSCVLVMIAQASCSINAFAFFTTPLVDDGIHEGAVVWFGLGFGAVSFFIGLLVLALTDRHGRTTLLLSGLPWLVLLSFILGAVFKIPDKDTRTAVVIVVALCFSGIYSFTLGPAAFSLAAESYPASVREVGMALCVCFNMLTLGLQLLVYPFVTARVGYSTSFCIYGVINIVALALCFLFTVDTQKLSLDDLQSTFELGIWMHCRYRFTEVLPKALGVLRTNITGYAAFALNLFLGKPPKVCDDIDPFYDWALDEQERRERREA